MIEKFGKYNLERIFTPPVQREQTKTLPYRKLAILKDPVTEELLTLSEYYVRRVLREVEGSTLASIVELPDRPIANDLIAKFRENRDLPAFVSANGISIEEYQRLLDCMNDEDGQYEPVHVSVLIPGR